MRSRHRCAWNGGFLGLIFSAHLFVVDAGQHVNTLAAERVLCEWVGLVDNLIATSRHSLAQVRRRSCGANFAQAVPPLTIGLQLSVTVSEILERLSLLPPSAE